MISAVVLLAAMSTAEKVVEGARAQLKEPAFYDASYQRIAYPNGDVPKDRGACTDVVVRAYRNAGLDLQVLIHKDRKSRGVRTDTNIDHRRVRNQVDYFALQGKSLPLHLDNRGRWQPGDIVASKLDNGLDHIGIVSDKKGASGNLMVIHNISKTAEEDVLAKWKVVGHFRYP